MKAYRESILDYSDVRDIVEYTRDESLEKGHAEGRVEGLAEGEWKKTVEVVMNSHKAGLSLETIALITELTVAEVEKIIASQRTDGLSLEAIDEEAEKTS
jgi:predicted transposase/invertase (TIGR01784 family)